MANLTLFEKLDQIESRYEEMTSELSSPEVHDDSARYQKLAKTHSELGEIVAKYREWKEIEKGYEGAKQLVAESDDAEMKQMAHDELRDLEARREIVERELKFLLVPKDPNDEKNVIVEIRAGTGGDEASLFAGELFRMYSRYAESQGWSVEVLESSPSSVGGMKEVVAAIQGHKVYSKLKYESGVHRVQRVPATEQQGRIHTSAATVAVLPEADDIDIKIEAKDLRDRYVLLVGPGRAIGEHDVFGGAHHAHSERARGFAAGRKIADQESREGHARAARAALRDGTGEAARSHRRRAPRPDQDGRPLRENPHVQFPAESRDRPSHQLHASSAHRSDGRQARAAGRRARDAFRIRTAEARAGGGVRALSHAEQRALSLDVRSVLREGMARLRAARIPSDTLAAEVLLLHSLGRDRSWLYSHAEEQLDPYLVANYFTLIARRAAGEPTQHLTGKQEFWGLEFEVTPAVLIPRPETEHVVEVALERLGAAGIQIDMKTGAPSPRLRIADVGTGSGCIAIALAHELPHAEIFATDISVAALQVARCNGARHRVDDRVHFVETDLLEGISLSPLAAAAIAAALRFDREQSAVCRARRSGNARARSARA